MYDRNRDAVRVNGGEIKLFVALLFGIRWRCLTVQAHFTDTLVFRKMLWCDHILWQFNLLKAFSFFLTVNGRLGTDTFNTPARYAPVYLLVRQKLIQVYQNQ